MTLQDLSATHIYANISFQARSRLLKLLGKMDNTWLSLVSNNRGVWYFYGTVAGFELKNVKHFFFKPDYFKDVICQNLVQSYSSLKQKAVYYSKQVDGWTYATYSNAK